MLPHFDFSIAENAARRKWKYDDPKLENGTKSGNTSFFLKHLDEQECWENNAFPEKVKERTGRLAGCATQYLQFRFVVESGDVGHADRSHEL